MVEGEIERSTLLNFYSTGSYFERKPYFRSSGTQLAELGLSSRRH